MPTHNDQLAGPAGGTGTGGCRDRISKTIKTAVLQSTAFIAGLGLYCSTVLAQPLGPGAPGETPAGGITRPGDFRPELPPEPTEAPVELPPGTLPEEPAEEVIEEEPPAEEEKIPYGARVFVKEVRLSDRLTTSPACLV